MVWEFSIIQSRWHAVDSTMTLKFADSMFAGSAQFRASAAPGLRGTCMPQGIVVTAVAQRRWT